MFNAFGFLIWCLKIIRNFCLKFFLFFKKCHCLERNLNYNHKSNDAIDALSDQQDSFLELANYKNIPIARGLPIFGTVFDLIAAGGAPKLHKYIHQQHQQYGPIFRERLGNRQECVFVASAILMRTVFLYEGQYPRHPLPEAWTLYNKKHNCQRGLFFMEGAEWLHNRRLLNRCLLNGNLDWMNAHIETCTDKLINNWRTKMLYKLDQGVEYFEVDNLETQLYRWAIDVICTIMFGSCASTCPQIELALDEFSQIVHKIFESSSVLMNFPPQLAKTLHLNIWKNFEKCVTEVLDKGSQIIDMFVALKQRDDEISVGFMLNDQEALFNKLQTVGMSLSLIKRIFIDLVIAAGDTTAYSSEWALYLLTQNADLQQNIAKEVLAGERYETSLVRGLIKETLRLYPVAPFIGRYLASDANIGGYQIQKDTLVLLSLYTSGRDDKHFPKPLAVRPERWLRNNENGNLQDVLQAHGTMPFAISNRSCIGRKIAINQMHSLISAICTNFQVKCMNPKPIDSILRLVTVPNESLQLAIKLREFH